MTAQELIAELNLSATIAYDIDLYSPEDIAFDHIRECAEMWAEENGASMKEAITANPEAETSIGSRIRGELLAYSLTYAEWQYAVACALSLHVNEAKQLLLQADHSGRSMIDFDVDVMTAAMMQEEAKEWADEKTRNADYSVAPYWAVCEGEVMPVKDFNDLDGFTLV